MTQKETASPALASYPMASGFAPRRNHIQCMKSGGRTDLAAICPLSGLVAAGGAFLAVLREQVVSRQGAQCPTCLIWTIPATRGSDYCTERVHFCEPREPRTFGGWLAGGWVRWPKCIKRTPPAARPILDVGDSARHVHFGSRPHRRPYAPRLWKLANYCR